MNEFASSPELIDHINGAVRLSYGVAGLSVVAAVAGYWPLLVLSILLAAYAFLLDRTHGRIVATTGLLALAYLLGTALIRAVGDLFATSPTANQVALLLFGCIVPLLLVTSAGKATVATFQLHKRRSDHAS
jgi:hypothetical protein